MVCKNYKPYRFLCKSSSTNEATIHQRVCVSLSDRRIHLPGQRPAHAPKGAETGRTGENPLSRTQAYILCPSTPERGRHQNLICHAGPLLRGVHPGHLRPRHHRNADQSSQHRQQLPLQRYPVFFPYGSESGSKGAAKNEPSQKFRKPNKTPAKSPDFTGVLEQINTIDAIALCEGRDVAVYAVQIYFI